MSKQKEKNLSINSYCGDRKDLGSDSEEDSEVKTPIFT